MEERIIFPAEWYPQSGVQLTWPHAGTDWAPILEEATDCFVAIAREIVKREPLLIVCADEAAVRRQLGDVNDEKIIFREMPTNDTWARDQGGITVLVDGRPTVYDFVFNGWGMKFAANYDNLITRNLAKTNTFADDVDVVNMQPFVLEGGSIETDGRGTLLTTVECLSSVNRNEYLNKEQLELHLKEFFGIKRILWLENGYLAGDDTDSHIDTLARFCDEQTIAYVQCTDEDDEHFAELQAMEEELKAFRTTGGQPYRLIPLPMPDKILWNGERLPATYANFLIINEAVLIPFYQSDKDKTAREALQTAFPDREVIGIDCRALLKQHGSLHCVTMQYPCATLQQFNSSTTQRLNDSTVNNMNALDLFLKYVTFDTQSDERATTSPSTVGQMVFAKVIAKQLQEMGLQDVSLDENGYIMATLPANTDEKAEQEVPVIGFIAHLDTSPDLSGRNVKPRIVTYQGGDIVLNEAQNRVLSPAMFPEMNDYMGQELVVTDGTTLLGADDKAGIAAIISAMQYLLEHDEIKHGKVRIGFTPDEEIGRGANHFDVDKFGCRWAYTIDGGTVGELEYENFNAAAAIVTIKGRNIHPGYAKDKMQNAMQQAIYFHNQLPANERPENTEKYEGFYHLTSISGTVEEATLSYIIRDHDRALFEAKKQRMRDIEQQMKDAMHVDIKVEIQDQYYNMREKVEPHKEIIDIAFEAMEQCGVKPLIKPIRGGTDGARLSFMGLPCPNIFAGGINFHGRYEYLPVQSLQKSNETIINIVRLTYDKYKH